MNAAVAEHREFAPPPVDGHGRAFVLALLAHVVLVAALTVGLQWKRSLPDTVVEAELWSAIPKPAAPKQVEPPPAPPPAPPKPAPRPVTKAEPPPGPSEADIALEKLRLEKEKLEKEKQALAQKLAQQKREQEKREKEKQLALEKKREQERQAALEKKKRDEEKAAAAAKLKEQKELEAKKLAAQKEQAEKKAKLEAERAAQKAKEEAERIEAARKENLQRMAGLAGATGAPGATGSAAKASGPSASYAGRVSAAVKPNIVFTDSSADNPVAEVEVRALPDGRIESRKLVKSSGNKAWDEAVLKAIDKTAVLPRDVDGTVPSLLVINFRRRD